MAKLFLRSGSLDAVLPLGENGQPVYLSALQLRETLRLRKQQQIADCLAIPQPNDTGTRLDWYAPINGKVISWAAASESVRSHALNQLIACQQVLAEMSHRALQAEKSGQKLFGALLAKALQFPDQNFVYLVGGKPVLTFWGFVSLDKKSRQDSLDCLRKVEDDPVPLNLSKMGEVSPPAIPVSDPLTVSLPLPAVPPEPTVIASEPPSDIAQSESALTPVDASRVASRASRPLLRYGWMLPAAALLIAFGMQIKSYVFVAGEAPAPQENHASTSGETEHIEKAPQSVPAIPAVVSEKTTLPVAPASVVPIQQQAAVTPPVEADKTGESATFMPAAKDDLTLPSDAVKLGSTRFLNGSWRAIIGGKNPLFGNPPSLLFQIKNGKGIAKITQGDGIVCKVDVYAGLIKSGNLVINSRTKAKCSDGSRYQMPDLTCKQGTNGAAECSGQYDANTVLPMTMKRESK